MTSRPLQPVAYPFGGTVEVAQINMTDARNLHAAVEFRTSFINNTSEPIVVLWRSGLKLTLPPRSDLHKSAFLARVEIQLSHEVKTDAQRILSGIGEDASAELKALRDAFTYHVERNRWSGAVITLDYPLTVEQLREYGGSIYYHELDVVVSLELFENVPPHPATEEGKNVHLTNTEEKEEESGFLYAVDVVDNLAVFGERFLNINGKAYKVKPKIDLNRRNGIYITSNRPSSNARTDNNKEVSYFLLEKAEELGLYRTMEEAMANGDLATARKQQLVELEHQLAVEKRKFQQLEQQHRLETAEKERELKKLEGDLKGADLRLQQMKDYYESRSFERKDQSETIKFLPTVLVGLGALFAFIKSLG